MSRKVEKQIEVQVEIVNPMVKYRDLINQVIKETQCRTITANLELVAYAQELAEGVTAARDEAIAKALPVPYQKRVPARAQLDGDELVIPRCVYVQASKVGDGKWNTSSRGPRMARVKAECAIGVHTELEIGDVQIVRIVILWRRAK